MANEPVFLNTDEAANMLNVHPNTISGKLPSSKIGSQYRIPRDAIENRISRAGQGTRIIAIANQKGELKQQQL